MAQVIPAILVETEEQVIEKIEIVKNLVEWVQLDVCDGVFTQSKTWNESSKIKDIKKDIKIEAHLMIQNPETVIDDWISSGVERIYIHYEATKDHLPILQKIKEAGVEAGIALLPQTQSSVINDIIDYTDAILVFSGSLGQYGGKFQESMAISKVKTLRNGFSDVLIEVDGGIDIESGKKVVDAGAGAIVSGGFIFNSEKPKMSLQKLQNMVKN